MEESRFDRSLPVMADVTSRRQALRALGTAATALLAAVGLTARSAAKQHKHPRRDKHRDRQHRKPRVDVQGRQASGPATLKVLTHNIYFGADLAPVFSVTTTQQLVQAVTQIFAMVQATNFPERAKALAKEIAILNPDIVALQEVALWRSQQPADFSPVPNAETVEYDFLAILLDELANRGKQYEAVAIVQNADAEAPRATPTGLEDIRFTDRNAILARAARHDKDLAIDNVQSANFAAMLTIPNPVLGTVPFPQGWLAVDATVRGRAIRVVNTHLERLHPGIQVAQANELLAGPLDTTLPVALLGDLNSAAGGVGAVPGQSDTPTYANLLAAGFVDAAAGKGRNAGFTCCQAADLANVTSQLSERIDYVLTRGAVSTSAVKLVGGNRNDKTSSGLWPSDHAGVAAVLHLRR